MANINIRDYMKARKKRKVVSLVNYKERIRGHKLVHFYRAMLGLLVAGGVIFALYIQWRDKIYKESVVTASAEVQMAQGTQIKNLAGNILYYSKDGISCMDSQGTARWNQTYEMQNPMVAVCQDVVAVGDYNGSIVYVMDTEKKLGEVDTNLPIRYLDVAANGEVIVVVEDGSTTRIYLYTAEGQEIAVYTTSMDKSGYPVDVSISPNGKLVGISYLYVDSGVMQTTVAFYNHGEVGQNNPNYFMSGHNYQDTVVPSLEFMDNETAFGLSDDRIMFFAGREKPVSIKENLLDEKVQSLYYNEDYVGLVFRNATGETLYRLDIYDKKGNLCLSRNFDFDYSEIIFTKNHFIIYDDLTCMICDMNGTEKYNGPFAKATALLIPTAAQNRYVAVSSLAVDLLEFR